MAARGNLLSSLNNDDADEIYKFIKFFDTKKDGILKVIASEFEEAVDLMDESEYRREEVANHVIAPLKQGVRQTVKDEQNTYVNMMVLLLKQMFESAEQEGCRIRMDMSEIEDVSLLQQVNQLRLDPPRNRPEAESKQEPSMKLVSIKDEHIQIMKDKARLEQELSTTTQRMREMQADLAMLQREKTSMCDEMEMLKTALARSQRNQAAEAESKSESKDSSSDNARLMEENARLTQMLREKTEDDHTKVSSSSQVQQLRRLLQQKNEMVSSLRSRLERYEPSNMRNDADDD